MFRSGQAVHHMMASGKRIGWKEQEPIIMDPIKPDTSCRVHLKMVDLMENASTMCLPQNIIKQIGQMEVV